ncbi:MAG TPA: hypothetical protein VMN60_12215 [Longimicrobiales bacterium]|nr:hypothetical protein [Longimicrobiales bacterium]
MPVSDRLTVLSKAMIPLVVLPLVIVVLSLVTHAVMVMTSITVLLASGGDVSALVQHVQPVQSAVTVLYTAVVIALWHAPIYGVLLLVSAWARRAALLWALLPLLAVGAAERIVFVTTGFFAWLRYLLAGWVERAFAFTDDAGTNLLGELTPGRLLSTSSLWLGLAFTALCITAAVRLRRYREPV